MYVNVKHVLLIWSPDVILQTDSLSRNISEKLEGNEGLKNLVLNVARKRNYT